MDVNSQKCPACGATLKFNPQTHNWKCEYCLSQFGIEDIEKMQAKQEANASEKSFSTTTRVDESGKEMVVYSCPSCGAELITDETTTATSCIYCKSTTIIKDRIKGEYLPDLLIPFEKVKQDAINGFKSCLKGKIFSPKEFSDPKNIDEITGVYVPFWLYDIGTSATWNGEGRNVKTWIAGNYRYVKTDIYSLARSGTMTFEKVPVDSSSKFEDALMDSIEPYTYSKLTNYNDAYLSGFLAEKHDVTKEDASVRMQERVRNTSIDELKATAKYDTVTTSASNVLYTQPITSNAMLPVWMLNIKYKDKMYHFAMNGETGKLIGEVPISVSKAITLTLLVFFATFIGFLFIFTLLTKNNLIEIF